MSSPAARRRIHDLMILAAMMTLAVVISGSIASVFTYNHQFPAPIFMLAVALVARFTTGYLYGIAASVLSVFFVNYLFSYPYMKFDMSVAGYPLTFSVMLLVSVLISALTTRIKSQEQLRAAAEMERMRADLLRSLSHDIRTPLTAIMGSSSLLVQKRLPPEQQQELLEQINKDAAWLIRTTENILSVTRVSGGDVKLKKEPEVLEEIVGSAVVKFRSVYPSVAVKLIPPKEIILVPMDGILVQQVLLNLFYNAAEHGLVTTSVEVSIADQGDRAVFCVSDNGAGIDQRLLPRIFDGTGSGSPSADGHRHMGIGLSACRSIIRAHGGDISASNIPGGGARFEFWLPKEEQE